MRRALSLLLLSLAVLLAPQSALATAAIDAATNAYRASLGLPALATRSELEALALARAREVAAQGFLSHPTDWSRFFAAIPGCESAVGENLAYYTAGAEPAGWPVSAWVKSPSHDANLRRDWDWQGSAVVVSGGYSWAAQVFAASCSAGPAPAPAPPGGGEPLPDAALGPRVPGELAAVGLGLLALAAFLVAGGRLPPEPEWRRRRR